MGWNIKKLEAAQKEVEKVITAGIQTENIADCDPEEILAVVSILKLLRAQNSLLIEQARTIFELNVKIDNLVK